MAMDDPSLHTVQKALTYAAPHAVPGAPPRPPLRMAPRAAFAPAAGRVLLLADYKQAELRIMLHHAGDGALTAELLDGEDPFIKLAARWCRKAPGAVSDAERTWAKSIAYGLLYGKGIHTLANELCIPVVEAEALVEAFKASMPGVTRWLDRVVAEARQQPGQPFVTTVAGRQRPLQHLLSTVRRLLLCLLVALACSLRALTPVTPLRMRRAAASWTICGPRRSARR